MTAEPGRDVDTPRADERRPGLLGAGALLLTLQRRLDWREEAQSAATIGAESAIGYLFLGVLLPGIHRPYAAFPGLLLFGLLLFGYFLPHLLDELRVWSPHYELILALGVALSLLVTLKVAAFPSDPWLSSVWLRGALDGLIIRPNPSLRPPWALVGIIVYVWWRGRTRAEPMMESAYQMLRWGMLATTIALLLILVAAPRDSLIRQTMPRAVVLFFVAALAAVGIARFRLEGLRSGTPLGPHWLATFAAPIAAIVLVAVVAAGIFSRRFLETLLVILGPFFWVLGYLVRALIIVIALLAFAVIAPILWLLERHGFNHSSFLSRLPIGVNPLAQVSSFAHNNLHVVDPVRYFIVGLVLFFVISWLVRYAYRRRRRWRESAAERRESILVWPEVVSSLPSRLRRLLRAPRVRVDSLAGLRGDPRWVHTVYIRETYARLVRRGAQAGMPLRPGMTPNEYEREAVQKFPAVGREIATITSAYDAARYGHDPAGPDAAARVRHAWQIIQTRHEQQN